MLIDFKPETPAYNFDQFFRDIRVFTNPANLESARDAADKSYSGQRDGLVGNLTSFVDTLGTPFEIDTRGKILVLEETHEPTNTVYRYLNDLKLAGKFNDCIGIIMGECSRQAAYGISYEDLINEFVVPLGKPLITNLATGHGMYKAALPIGATVQLDSVNNRITTVEPTVSV